VRGRLLRRRSVRTGAAMRRASRDELRSVLAGAEVPDADEAFDRGSASVAAAFAAGEVRRALETVEVPEAAAARERAWAAVSAELVAGPSERQRRARRARRGQARAAAVAVAVALLGLAVAASATPPGAAVRGFVVRVLGREAPPPRAHLGPLPAGRMLVTSAAGAWIVARDGSRRRLGPYSGAAWSPRGLYAVVWSGAVVRAVAPDGRIAWTLRTPGRVASAAWSPDGFRVAYRRGLGLGLVAGDGTAPQVLASRVAPAGPAWRPGSPHTLAWVDAEGRLVVRDVDTRALVFSWPARFPAARELAWSSDGRRLLVRTRSRTLLFDLRANRLRRVRLGSGRRIVGAAWAPRGGRLAVVVRQAGGELSGVVVARSARGIARAQPIFQTTGPLGAPAWSPDGRRVLVRWADADQWLLLPAASSPALRPIAIGAVARRFGGVPVVRGWCCAE
jgi:WD40-like Beta Propeller Repeat